MKMVPPDPFAFFGDPVVPVLYAAETEEAAVCESILHEVPPTGGAVQFDYHVADRVAASFTPSRDLRRASLMGDGLRILGAEAKHVTGTMASRYKRAFRWAEAAHSVGYVGLVWMQQAQHRPCLCLFRRQGGSR